MIKPLQQDDGLLADINASRDHADGAVRLWWLGQSGFLLQRDGRHILIDPYLSDSLTKKYAATDKPHVRMSERVVDPGRLEFVDVVTSSHNHTDHLDGETLGALMDASPGFDLIIPEANRSFVAQRLGTHPDFPVGLDGDGPSVDVRGFRFGGVPAAHPELERDDRGRYRYLGYVIRCGRMSVYHSGDTVSHAAITDRLGQLLEPIDVAILPINGKVGNMNGVDAARLAKAIGAKVVIPCHYDMFEFNTADPYAQFVPECERIGQRCQVLKLGERWSSEELI